MEIYLGILVDIEASLLEEGDVNPKCPRNNLSNNWTSGLAIGLSHS
jgi:hypothetical protein